MINQLGAKIHFDFEEQDMCICVTIPLKFEDEAGRIERQMDLTPPIIPFMSLFSA